MKILKRLKGSFSKEAQGIALATATALAPLTLASLPSAAEAQTRAQTTQAEVNEFIHTARHLNNNVYPSREQWDMNRTNALYVNFHRFFLEYNGQNYAGYKHSMSENAAELARIYGLTNSSQYRDFRNALARHSNFAETYLANEGQGMAYADNDGLVGMKYQAIIDVQRTGAAFVEQIIPHFNANTASDRLHTLFGRVCYFNQVMDDEMQELYRAVHRRNGRGYNSRAMTLETNYGSGRRYTCPTPRK
jgi:hypothetical protein